MTELMNKFKKEVSGHHTDQQLSRNRLNNTYSNDFHCYLIDMAKLSEEDQHKKILELFNLATIILGKDSLKFFPWYVLNHANITNLVKARASIGNNKQVNILMPVENTVKFIVEKIISMFSTREERHQLLIMLQVQMYRAKLALMYLDKEMELISKNIYDHVNEQINKNRQPFW